MSNEVKSDEELSEDELEAKYSAPDELEESETQEESTDTQSETVEETEAKADEESTDTETDTAEESQQEEVDPITEAFRSTGLDKTYTDPVAVLKSHSEQQSEIGRLRRELGTTEAIKELLERPTLAPPPPQKESFNRETYDDLLLTSPIEASNYVDRFKENPLKDTVTKLEEKLTQSEKDRKEDLVRAQAKEQLDAHNAFKKEHPDYNSKEADIVRLLIDDPELNRISGVNPNWAIETAYKLVSVGKMPQELTNGSEPSTVSKSKLAKATTSSGGKSRKATRSSGEYTDDELNNMTEEELEKLFPSVE